MAAACCGLSSLTLTRHAPGSVTAALMAKINLAQPPSDIGIGRLDTLRAQSAVRVERDGVQHAIVSDDSTADVPNRGDSRSAVRVSKS